jgi:hypothetical protein
VERVLHVVTMPFILSYYLVKKCVILLFVIFIIAYCCDDINYFTFRNIIIYYDNDDAQ